jgi:hypothetical protein
VIGGLLVLWILSTATIVELGVVSAVLAAAAVVYAVRVRA